MDLMDVGETGSGCEEKDCGIASSFPGGCTNQECVMEERTFGLIELVCVTVIYILLMLCGLIGNILTILVVVLRPYMRSSAYLYLSSMAVSDLLILLLLPLDLYKLWRPRPWPLGDLACKLTMFLSECCTFCTILHITFLSLERYLAICWPITAKTLVTRRRTRTVIGCLWLGAAVSAAPVLIMVGVEDIGGEEHGLGHWKEERGWRHIEVEQRGLLMSGGERGSGHAGFLDGGLERMHWGGKETRGWDEMFGGKGENGLGPDAGTEKKREDGGEKREEGGEEEESEMKPEGVQRNKKKEDEGGGREWGPHRGHAAEFDMRECRCTHYAVSSGLLSAMMILSNLYFLIPLCILGLMYSLIGRMLCLRPKSSRRDQSHRHTNKMLGVIVLAFVLCWLPFHVGRTIFSLSMGGGVDEQEPYSDLNPQLDVDPLSDDVASAFIRSESSLSATSATFGQIGKIPTETLSGGHEALTDSCSRTEVKMSTYIDPPHQKHPNSSTRGSQLEAKPQAETHDSSLPKDQIGSPGFINSDDIPATNTYAATPANPHHNATGFNDTYRHPGTHSYFLYYLSQYFNLVSSVLFYLSAAVNPLLYNLMSSRYRHAVHSLVRPHAHRQRHRLRTISTQYSTTML